MAKMMTLPGMSRSSQRWYSRDEEERLLLKSLLIVMMMTMKIRRIKRGKSQLFNRKNSQLRAICLKMMMTKMKSQNKQMQSG